MPEQLQISQKSILFNDTANCSHYLGFVLDESNINIKHYWNDNGMENLKNM
jgi:hypothetical protein